MTMSPDRKFSFVALLFLFFLVSVGAVHGQPPHRRRSLALKKGIHRRLDALGVSADVPAVLDSLLGGSQTSDSGGASPSGSSSPQPSPTDPPTTDPGPTTNPPQTSTPSPSNPPSTTDPPSTSQTPSSPPPTSDPSSPSPSSEPATSSDSPAVTSPPSTPSPSSASASPTVNCPLGLDLAGNCVLPPASSPSSSSPSNTPTQAPAPSSPAPTSTPSTPDSSTSAPNSPSTSAPQSDSPPSSQPPPSSSSPSSPSPVVCLSPSILINGLCVLPSSSTPSSLPDSATAAPSSSPQQPPSDSATPAPSSSPQQSPPSSQPPASKIPTPSPVICLPPAVIIDDVCVIPQSSVPESATNVPSPLTQSAATSQPVVTPPSSKDQSSSASPVPSPSSPIDPCGPVGRSLGLCSANPSSTPNSPGSSSSGVVSSTQPSLTAPLPTSSTPIESCGPDGIAQGLCSVFPSGSASSSVSGASSGSGASLTVPPATSSFQNSASSSPGSISSPTSVPLTVTPGISSNATTGSLSSSSSGPVISFPSGTTNSLSQTANLSMTASAGSSSSTFTASANSQFSFVTMTSLLGASVSSSSIPITQTNPDAPLTTLSLPTPSNTNSGPPSTPTLPSNLPARIYPPTQLDLNTVSSGYTFCSLLFTAALRWDFVAQYTESQGQIFAWTPVAIDQALGTNASFTFALQVFVPSEYTGPADVDLLRTEYLFYLRSDQVPALANQIKVQSSPFYQVDFPFRQISMNVDASFALTSVSNPDEIPGSPSSATSRGDKSRTNTIIGVVSGLGGLALIVLGVLIFNGVKRSRELRHRRLSDPNVANDPYPDRAGRDFDQDSIGGQRRRSFYFAEDSLRGQQTVEQSAVPLPQASTQYVVQPGSQIQYSQGTGPESMRERRPPVGPVSISAPVLTQSSLNW